jgi:RNA polymerase sigma-70 factor (ECF subfamily)
MAAASIPLPDERLMPRWDHFAERIRSREEQALGELYDQTSKLVYSLALRILGNSADAEEVVCDVYAQVWRNAQDFDRARGSFLSWVLLIARSRALDRLRARATRDLAQRPMEESLDLPGHFPDAEETTQLNQRRRLIRLAISELAGEQRQLIEMAFFEGLSHTELAERLRLPLGTVKTRIRLGMMKLKDRLTPQRDAL